MVGKIVLDLNVIMKGFKVNEVVILVVVIFVYFYYDYVMDLLEVVKWMGVILMGLEFIVNIGWGWGFDEV